MGGGDTAAGSCRGGVPALKSYPDSWLFIPPKAHKHPEIKRAFGPPHSVIPTHPWPNGVRGHLILSHQKEIWGERLLTHLECSGSPLSWLILCPGSSFQVARARWCYPPQQKSPKCYLSILSHLRWPGRSWEPDTT